MRRNGVFSRGATLALLVLVISMGCYMGHMSTARTVGDGKVGLTGAVTYIPWDSVLKDIEGISVEGDTTFGALQLQGRVDFGLNDKLDFGVVTGAGFMFVPYWTGTELELKYALINDPESVGLSVGATTGITNWGLTAGASLYFDSNLSFLPIYFSVRPQYALSTQTNTDNDDIETKEGYFLLNFAVGLHFDLSPTIRLLVEGTNYNPDLENWKPFRLWNIGAGLQFSL